MFGASISNAAISSFVMASFCAYAVIGVGFYQFGVSIATDRETNWERFQRVLPRVFWPKLLSRLFAAGVFALIAVLLVVAAAEIMAKPSAEFSTVVKMILTALAIVLPFALFGVALGYWTTARSAVPIANMIFLPLAYLGGLWTHPSEIAGNHPADFVLYTDPPLGRNIVGRGWRVSCAEREHNVAWRL